MSKLKFWTTVTLIFGVLALLAFPFILARKPASDAPREMRAQFAMLMTSYTVLLLIVFFVLTVLAWRVMVKQREEYRRASLENLKDLVEGTLQDHQRKQDHDGS